MSVGNVKNIVIFGGAELYIAPKGTTPPTFAVAKGTAWTGPWVRLGATPDGSKATIKHSFENRMVKSNDFTANLKAFRTSDTVGVTVPLLEATLANLKYAQGAGTLTVGSTETTLDFGAQGGNLAPFAIGLEGFGTGTDDTTVKYRRYFIWAAVPSDGADQELGKEETVLNMTYDTLVDTTKAVGKELYQIVELN